MSDKHFFEDKTAWVTGASSGIGEALAKRLSSLGAKVIISARNEKELERVAEESKGNKHSIIAVPFDLSDPHQVEEAARKVIDDHTGVDFLFNNGGISQRTTALDTDVETDRKIMEVNFFSGVILTKKLLPLMIQRGGGHIIAISSISGLFGFPLRSAYSASKHALNGFYETLWTELWDKGIRTTVVCPGRVRTNISFRALDKGGKPHGKMDKGQEEGISPERTADEILKAVRKDKRMVLIGGKELIMVHLKRFFPGIFYRLVTRIKPT